jgi:hypothetical protein
MLDGWQVFARCRACCADRSVRFALLLAVACAAIACGSTGDETQAQDGEDGRTWSVENADSGTDAGVEPDDADSTSESGADTRRDDGDGDATDQTDSSWTAVTCASGQAREAAFEGATINPATRLTLYVRNDCALVGSVAASMEHGNFTLTIRGQLDPDGSLSMSGRAPDHHADVSGQLHATEADLDIVATFDGIQFERNVTLRRIE